ncbi:hypothetical protein J4573_18090 [Actinomadura barringtoniae]|uniref:Lipoprotein n=1 Tax=Actinomadura barringtoniae TaxID=1427535 RepID=A0A939T528_9ACTN|nr:SCO0930 family lipoprotein [Actinomadura barringtoniae]MBO2449019.1 hypothetical protein [Actinomadura barringtoniae]
MTDWRNEMDFPKWAIPAAAALTATGLVLTACGTEQANNKKNLSAGAQAKPQQDTAQQVAEPTTLEVASVSKIGKVVTNGEGKTLYRFDKDTARPPASTCMGACAKAWPPVWASNEDPQVKGVDESLVGKVKRPDGKWQVTLNGWPLYTYAKDQSPGDAKGQGVGKTWYAAAPDGKKAAANVAAQPTQQGGRWAGWTSIKVKQDAKYGAIVTDGKGRVMYRYDKDKPKDSTCFGACKKAWPPVTFNGWKKLKLEGIERKDVNFIERKDDGKCQLTINGWPMYYYEKDTTPGDTNGQAVGNVWWLVSPTGKKITTAPSAG